MIRSLAWPLIALAATPAGAACDTANTHRFDWNSQPQASQTYGTTYNHSAANGAGAERAFTVQATANGLATPQVAGIPTPVIAAINEATTGTGQFTYTIGGRFTARTPSITAATQVAIATFTFAAPVRDVAFRLHDVDFRANEYRDWVRIVGYNGAASYLPIITRPSASTVRIGPSGTAPAVATGDLLGASESQEEQDIGTVLVSFAQPITRFEVRYGNYPLQAGETATGQQWISIHDISFCPMPALVVAKTSAPYNATGPHRFNAPGSDVVYAIAVTNNGGSPVDLGGLVLTDLLPTQASFYNGDFDPAAAGSGPFQLSAGTSGVTLASAGVSYSSGGAGYGYAPVPGYDQAVRAIRLAPGGSLAANSGFTFRFRARIR